MSTATKKTSINLITVAIGEKTLPVYATPNGIKLGAKGKVTQPGEFFGNLPHSARRQIRRAARANGRHDIAGARTVHVPIGR
jgi:hypothetical protein